MEPGTSSTRAASTAGISCRGFVSASSEAPGLLAAPFYVNVGLLAHRRAVNSLPLESWEELAKECMAWEQHHGDSDLFFDCPKGDQNCNSLFFEILHSLAGPPIGDRSAGCGLEAWVTSDAARRALVILHRLCARAYRQSPTGDEAQSLGGVTPRALVWRHWFTTLNAMMADMHREERADIAVRPLPNAVSVIDDCFLAVPSYSAAPDVGLILIRLFTSSGVGTGACQAWHRTLDS